MVLSRAIAGSSCIPFVGVLTDSTSASELLALGLQEVPQMDTGNWVFSQN